jgi:hypothetical protein
LRCEAVERLIRSTRTVNGKGAEQRREALRLSTRSKSSKGRNAAGSFPGAPTTPWCFGATVGEGLAKQKRCEPRIRDRAATCPGVSQAPNR